MFYDRFVKLCETKGMSPAAVAKEIGLSNSSTTTWKRGSVPKGDTLQKIADYFSVPVDYLLDVYTPMEGITVSGDPDDVAAVKDLLEKAQTHGGQKTYGRLTYEALCALHELNLRDRLDAAYAKLNLLAHEKVADFAEKLTKNPKYLANKDTVPSPDVPEMPPEDK